MTPKTQALRYRIWAYAAPRGWNVTFGEVAEELGVQVASILNTAKGAGWEQRFRAANSINADHKRSGGGGAFFFARHLAREIAAGRVGVDQ